jgi:hypothetical protein
MLSINLLLAFVVIHVIVSVVLAVSAPMRAIFGARKIAAIVATSVAFNIGQYLFINWVDNATLTTVAAGLYALSTISLAATSPFLTRARLVR